MLLLLVQSMLYVCRIEFFLESSYFTYSDWNNLVHVYPWCGWMRPVEILSGLKLLLYGFICNTICIKSSLGHTRIYFCKKKYLQNHWNSESQFSMSSISPQVLSSFKSLPLENTSFIFNLLHQRKCLKAVISHRKPLQHWLSKSVSYLWKWGLDKKTAVQDCVLSSTMK